MSQYQRWLVLSRRNALKGVAALGALGAFGSAFLAGLSRAGAAKSTLTFEEVPHGMAEDLRSAPGYSAQVLIRWGDRVVPDAPDFDLGKQSAAAQEKQFGYNNDFTAFMPLPAGSDNSDRGLLCVNHEFTTAHLMWPVGAWDFFDRPNKARMEVEMAAHGHSVVEIEKIGAGWRVVEDSRYNRRITALGTPLRISGPAAGHERLKTRADPTGTRVIGTLNDCAGGATPWGTLLIAEESFHRYFTGDIEGTGEERNYRRYGIGGKRRRAWARHHERFDLEKEPNEANRFGWVVEIDPYDPASTPVKRTAL
ncbi:MAG: alkaline phosphatase PhoX, partial [Kiloniellales bacterium]